MSTTKEKGDLKVRTRDFALRVIKLVESLPKRKSATVLGNQLLRAATSIGANYRAASRARSRAEFISKLNIAMEEADETLYWLELIRESSFLTPTQIHSLVDEANQLVAILTASTKTARQNSALGIRK